MSSNNFEDVGDFHEKFGLSVTDSVYPGPYEVDDELLEFRLKFLFEEVMEFIEASGYVMEWDPERGSGKDAFFFTKQDRPRDHAKMFDALIDEVYVAMGTAHLFGYPWSHGWALVQRANMTKIRATKSEDSARGGTWDVIKPPGWVAPDIEGLLNFYGWDQQ